MIVIIPCGAAKLDHKAPAVDLYVGSLFRAGLTYARSLVPDNHILILSALHGLVDLRAVIEPYDLRMGRPGCVSPQTVRGQATARGVMSERDVIVCGGKDYVQCARAAIPHARSTLAAMILECPRVSMGHMMAWYKKNKGRRV